jgi:hypothetical protein
MKKLPFKSLLDDSYTADGNRAEFIRMSNVVKMFRGDEAPADYSRDCHETPQRGQLDEIFDHLVEDREEYDGYYIYGEMANQFIQTFPEMREAWSKLNADQKWIFMEGLYYGCHQRVNNFLGYKQTG